MVVVAVWIGSVVLHEHYTNAGRYRVVRWTGLHSSLAYTHSREFARHNCIVRVAQDLRSPLDALSLDYPSAA